jgi:hypothetical protein
MELLKLTAEVVSGWPGVSWLEDISLFNHGKKLPLAYVLLTIKKSCALNYIFLALIKHKAIKTGYSRKNGRNVAFLELGGKIRRHSALQQTEKV